MVNLLVMTSILKNDVFGANLGGVGSLKVALEATQRSSEVHFARLRGRPTKRVGM